MHEPVVLFNLKDFNRVIDFLLRTAEESSKRIYELIIDRAGWQVMTLVLHGSNLHPFILSYDILLHWIKPLLSAETTQYEYVPFTQGNCVCVAWFWHWLLCYDFVLRQSVDAGIFLGRRATTSYQNFEWGKSDGCGTLVEFASVRLVQLLETPFIFVYVVTEWNFGVYIVTKQ